MTPTEKQAAYAAERARQRGEPVSKVAICAMAPHPTPRMVLIRGTFPDGSTKEDQFPELLDAVVAWPEAVRVEIVGGEPGSFY